MGTARHWQTADVTRIDELCACSKANNNYSKKKINVFSVLHFHHLPPRTGGFDVIRNWPGDISCYCNIPRILINSMNGPGRLETFGSGASPQRLRRANVTVPRSGILKNCGLSSKVKRFVSHLNGILVCVKLGHLLWLNILCIASALYWSTLLMIEWYRCWSVPVACEAFPFSI